MYNIALHIKTKDWLYILFIGVAFGMFLSSFGYGLLGLSWFEGGMYGFILGFIITLFSLGFISFMNHFILPKMKKVYWTFMSALFSFLSGFLGFLFATPLSKLLNINILSLFETHYVKIAASIGVLTYIVGALLYRFVKMRNEKELIDNQYIQSRLRSLETQLNPHFLFNALNSIAELIHHNPDKAEMAVLKVSSFLRNTMNEKALMSLEDEIKNVLDYVELENIRFSGRIHLHTPETLPRWSVPKFSIQLIVENAIKHGFGANKEKLNIWIDFGMYDNRIIIKNDGLPMRTTSFGVGLTNLNQRLELLCGGSVSVHDYKEPTFYINIGDTHENTHRR